MKKVNAIDGMALAVWLVPVIYLAGNYSRLPEKVALHFRLDGTPDRYGSVGEFLGVNLLMAGVSVFTYLLMRFVSSIDPKKDLSYSEKTFQKIGLVVVVFLSAIHLIIIFSAIHSAIRIDKLILPLIGLLFACIGNLMHSIKPNYFVGVRTPWTLEDPDNWKATHRLTGKLWFTGGMALTLVTLLLPNAAGALAFRLGIIGLAVVPLAYSYLYFKRHHRA